MEKVLILPSKPWTVLGRPGRRTRILILKVDHIGDMILAFPAMEMLRDAFRDTHFTLVCAPGSVQIAQATGLFDEIIPFKYFAEFSEDSDSEGFTPYPEIRKLVKDLHDLAIDLRFDPDTRPLLKYIDAHYRAGYAAGGPHETRLDLALPPTERTEHKDVEFHRSKDMTLLASAVINEFSQPKWDFLDRLLSSGPALDDKLENFVVLAPGAGTSVKKWPQENFASLAAMIHEEGKNMVVIGGPREGDYAKAIAQAVPAESVTNLVGKLSLLGLPKLFARAKGFVGNDTGVTHLAAMMGVKTLCLFSGAPDVNIWRAFGASTKIIKAEVDCSPCRIISPKDCTGEGACMTSIFPSLVFEELKQMLA